MLEQEFGAASNGRWPLSIIFLDIDHFKLVNDTYGHPAGDTVLRGTAQALIRLVRNGDCVARYGGEEFVLLMPGLNRPGAAAVSFPS